MTVRRVVVATAGGVLGLALSGVPVAIVGAALGALIATAPRVIAAASASLLVATALFAVTETSLDLASFGQFPSTRPLANATALAVTVAWTLAVVAGWVQSARDPAPTGDDRLVAASVDRGSRRAGGLRRLMVRVRRPSNQVFSGSAWMLASTAAISIGSFVFWILAARTAPQAAVGSAAALFSVVTFLNYATSLGLPIALPRYASDDSTSSSVMFTWAIVLTALASLVGTGIFALVAPASVHAAIGGRGAWGWGIVALNTVGLSLSVVVDVRCMSLDLWRWVFWRAVVISLSRLPLMAWVPDDGTNFFLFNVAAGAYGLTALPTLVLVLLRPGQRLRLRPVPAFVRAASRFAAVNFLGQLAVRAPFFAVPIIVLATVRAEENASFYVAWGIMSVVVISVQVIGQVLLVEGARVGADRASQVRTALGMATLVTALSLGAVAAFGPMITVIYGTGYESVASLLVILVGGTAPYVITFIGLSDARVRGDNRATMVITFAYAALVLVPAFVLTDLHGADGAAWGWLIGNATAALLVAAAYGGSVAGSPRRSTRIQPRTGRGPSGVRCGRS